MALPSLRIDGVWTMEARKALQRHMKKNGWYIYGIDGIFGIDSKKGLQKMLKYHGRYSRAIDGDFGWYARSGLHFFLVYTWGSSTYLQRSNQGQYYAAPWWAWTRGDELYVKEVTRALQSGLNRHGHY